MIKIRKYQKDCIKACDKLSAEKGQIILPTGSGKTVIAEEVVKNLAIKNKCSVTIVFVPRLVLGKQWIRRTAETLIRDSGLRFAFVNVNSGGISNNIRKLIEEAQLEIIGAGAPKIPVTTNPQDVYNHVKRLLAEKFNVVIVCTYHSSNVLLKSTVHADLAIYDECQYLVGSQPENNKFVIALQIPSKKRLFFTATPKTTPSNSGRGMNNPDIFGNIIFEKKPREIIEAGAIVSPKIHLIGCLDDAIINGRNYNARMDVVFTAWQKHKQVIKETSVCSDMIGAKLLVVVDGQEMLRGILNCRTFKKIRQQNPSLKMYALSSEFGVYINGDMRKPPASGRDKEDLLDELFKLSYNDDMIIFHVDMIAEGIDVPGITGVLPYRNCSKVKLLQNFGRAGRLHKEDQIKIFETGELKVADYNKYIKPYCYIILPYVLEDREDFLQRHITIIDALRTEYGFDPSENVIGDMLYPYQTGPEWDENLLNRQARSIERKIYDYYQLVEDKNMNIEKLLIADKIERMSEEQRLQLISKAAK